MQNEWRCRENFWWTQEKTSVLNKTVFIRLDFALVPSSLELLLCHKYSGEVRGNE